jgi:hypothetical protein
MEGLNGFVKSSAEQDAIVICYGGEGIFWLLGSACQMLRYTENNVRYWKV